MGCGCSGGRRAGQRTAQGVVSGFRLVLPDGSEKVYDTHIEAKKHQLLNGGTIYQVMQP